MIPIYSVEALILFSNTVVTYCSAVFNLVGV
jgi:hypothetical protein